MNKKVYFTLFIVLALGLAASFSIFFLLKAKQVNVAKNRFELLSETFVYSLEQRLLRNQVLLQGAAGFVNASEYVSKSEWQRYVKELNLPQTFPAIQWIGLAKVLADEDEITQFIKTIQEKEDPNFKIWPAISSEATPLLYVYPSDSHHLVGYNLLKSEAVEEILQDPELNQNLSTLLITPGIRFNPTERTDTIFLLFYPAFSNDSKSRGKDFWVVASIDFVNLVDFVSKEVQFEDANMEVYAGNSTNPQDMIFERGALHDPNPVFTYQETIKMGNWEVTFLFKTSSKYRNEYMNAYPYLILFILIGATIGILYLLYRELNKMHLIRSTNHKKLDTENIVDSMQMAAFSTDTEGLITLFNKAAEIFFQVSASEVISKMNIEDLIDPESFVKNGAEFSRILNKELKTPMEIFFAQIEKPIPNQVVWTFSLKDKSKKEAYLSMSGIRDANDNVIGYLGVIDPFPKINGEKK